MFEATQPRVPPTKGAYVIFHENVTYEGIALTQRCIKFRLY